MIIVNGVKYDLHYGMNAIEGVMIDLGCGDDFEAAGKLLNEASKNTLIASRLAKSCAYRGIVGWHRIHGHPQPFESLEHFGEVVTKLEEILPAVAPFTTMFVEFYKLNEGGKESKKKQTAKG